MPAANTFGTFLSTLETLKRDNAGPSDALVSDTLARVVQTLPSQGEVPLKSIVGTLNVGRPEALRAVLQGQRDGLILLEERDGEAFATLTPVGRAFVD